MLILGRVEFLLSARHSVLFVVFMAVPGPLLALVPVFFLLQLHKLLEQFLLARRKALGDSYLDFDKKVASAVASQPRDAFAGKTHHLPGLGPRSDI